MVALGIGVCLTDVMESLSILLAETVESATCFSRSEDSYDFDIVVEFRTCAYETVFEVDDRKDRNKGECEL